MAIKTVYWDACVFHAVFGMEKDRFEICERVDKAARDGNVHIYTSAVTFVECVWVKTVTDPTGKLYKLSPQHEERMQKYFGASFIKLILCDRPIAEAARALLWKYQSLHPKDAIHVASAVAQSVEIMHTYDDALLKLNGQIGAPALKICKPGDGDGF